MFPFPVSNPFIAGHSFLPMIEVPSVGMVEVSNPFIAGHSFLRHWAYPSNVKSFSFKPLHSGAFLLTQARIIFVDDNSKGFKPLHSGAFLLTSGAVVINGFSLMVSNPFIAGHSFLLVVDRGEALGDDVSNPFIAGHSFLLFLIVFPEDENYEFQTPS